MPHNFFAATIITLPLFSFVVWFGALQRLQHVTITYQQFLAVGLPSSKIQTTQVLLIVIVVVRRQRRIVGDLGHTLQEGSIAAFDDSILVFEHLCLFQVPTKMRKAERRWRRVVDTFFHGANAFSHNFQPLLVDPGIDQFVAASLWDVRHVDPTCAASATHERMRKWRDDTESLLTRELRSTSRRLQIP